MSQYQTMLINMTVYRCFLCSVNFASSEQLHIQGVADKSLARPTSRCHRTERIVSLKRGVCSCANCKSFLVTEAERKHVRRRARFQQHRHASCHQVFFLQGKVPKEIHAILKETLGEHVPSYTTIKNWVTQFNVAIFPPVLRLVLDDPKQ